VGLLDQVKKRSKSPTNPSLGGDERSERLGGKKPPLFFMGGGKKIMSLYSSA